MGPFCVTRSNPTHQLSDSTRPDPLQVVEILDPIRPDPIQLTMSVSGMKPVLGLKRV